MHLIDLCVSQAILVGSMAGEISMIGQCTYYFAMLIGKTACCAHIRTVEKPVSEAMK